MISTDMLSASATVADTLIIGPSAKALDVGKRAVGGSAVSNSAVSRCAVSRCAVSKRVEQFE
jgi:hypothetical protein